MGFALDTNLYIAADRDPAQADALIEFYERHLSQTHLHAVVVQEMLAGAVSPMRASCRTIRFGSARARSSRGLTDRALVSPGAFRRSFVNDVILARVVPAVWTYVTANLRDFELIKEVERFEFVPPFPG